MTTEVYKAQKPSDFDKFITVNNNMLSIKFTGKLLEGIIETEKDKEKWLEKENIVTGMFVDKKKQVGKKGAIIDLRNYPQSTQDVFAGFERGDYKTKVLWIRALHDEGLSNNEITQLTGLYYSQVYEAVKKYKK